MQRQKAFLSILSDYIYNRPTHLGGSINWDDMLDIARKHQLTNIIIEQCESDYIDAKTQNTMLTRYMASMTSKAAREKYISDITIYLKNKNIPFCILKGTAIAKYYHKSEHRSMGDVDILLKSDAREELHTFLLSIGFKNHSKNINYEWVYMNNSCEVEIHDKLIYPEPFNKEKEEALFKDPWTHIKDNELEINYHFLYLINHLKKHLTSSGAGFRQFIDLCMILKYCTDLDKNLVIKYLKESEMYEFAQVVFSLCSYWFNDKSLYFFNENFKISDDALASMTETIFENGVFGQYNQENKANVSVNHLRYSKFKFISKIRIVFVQLFPSYNNMLATNNYSFLENKPFLLPIAWIYRGYINIKNKRVARFFDKKLKFASTSEQEKRENEMEQWHII